MEDNCDKSMAEEQRLNLYGVLGVNADATQVQIRKAYHTKIISTHPDKNLASLKEAKTLEYIELQSAYNILVDPNQRQLYDEKIQLSPSVQNVPKFFPVAQNVNKNDKREMPNSSRRASRSTVQVTATLTNLGLVVGPNPQQQSTSKRAINPLALVQKGGETSVQTKAQKQSIGLVIGPSRSSKLF